MRISLKVCARALTVLAVGLALSILLGAPGSPGASAQGLYGSVLPQPADPAPSIATAAAAAAPADEVLGVSQTPDSPPLALPELAFTGSSVSWPLAFGSALVGTGGLLVLTARKRELQS